MAKACDIIQDMLESYKQTKKDICKTWIQESTII
jgi:hypothetical protein